jgi:uncharacterized protein (DUF1499 family)
MNESPGTQAQKPPALVNWLGYLAITLLVLLPLSVLMVRSGGWEQGLLLYAVSCLGAGILLLLAALLMVLPRFAPWRKALALRALITLPGTVLLLSILGAGDYPAIHDITTDLQSPPVFTAAMQQREPGSNSLEIDPETLAMQAEAYPALQTLVTARDYDDTFDQAVGVATELGWDIYLQDRTSGVIEAVDTTAVMGFKDDIVIRLRTNADGTLVDLRSVSRVGIGDLGANAARIRAFLERLEQQ